MEELPHLLLVSRGALLCLVENEKSFLSQLETEASTKDRGGEGPLPDLVERAAHGS